MSTLKTILLLLALAAGVISMIAIAQVEEKHTDELRELEIENSLLKKRVELLETYIKAQSVYNAMDNPYSRRVHEGKLLKITDKLD